MVARLNVSYETLIVPMAINYKYFYAPYAVLSIAQKFEMFHVKHS